MKLIGRISLVFFAAIVFFYLPVFAEQNQFSELVGKWQRFRYNQYTPDHRITITGVENNVLKGSFYDAYPFTATLNADNSRVELVKGKVKVEIKLPTVEYTLYLTNGELSGEVYVKVGQNRGQTFKAVFQKEKE